MSENTETSAMQGTILIVDDEPANIDILNEILGAEYRTKVAVNGKRALAIAAAASADLDLILLDVMMPETDGHEVCRRLKQDPSTANIPVIFVTAKGAISDEQRGFEVGAVDYIVKPVSPPIVKARVRTQLMLQEQRRRIERALAALQELEELRDSLVHMIVHDMRSPLMGMNGLLEILRDELGGTLSEEFLRDLNEALTSGHSLQEMISSLLDVSRLEAGEMRLERSCVDLRVIASDALASLVSLVKQCTVVYEPPVEAMAAWCDAEITRRVIANLVANAIKFTPSSGEVRIDLISSDEGATVSVSDTGPGIPLEDQARIFQKFGQVAGRQEGRKYSTGLGLTFCKLAVEAHGGRIGVDSELGAGSKFWFTLPSVPFGVSSE